MAVPEKWEIFCYHFHEEDMHELPVNGDTWIDVSFPVPDSWEPISVTFTGEVYMVWCKRRVTGP